MNIKTGDKVIVIAGRSKGQTGKVIRTSKKDNRVAIEGVNLVKKHLKPNANNQTGSIIEKEAPLHVSNVMLLDPKTGKRTRKRIEEVKVKAKVKKTEEIKETKKDTKTKESKTTKTKKVKND